MAGGQAGKYPQQCEAMKEKIILIGGGGHCKSCIDVIEQEGRFTIAGIVDVKGKIGQKVLDCKIVACDEDFKDLIQHYSLYFITIGQIKPLKKRMERFNQLKEMNAKFPVIISPRAYVSRYANIDEGTIIMHNAFINANARIVKNCIINTGALIEHDVKIGNNSHIATRSVLNGECTTDENTFIGSNSVLANNLTIAANTLIGAGSVVIKSIFEDGTYVGNPARRIISEE